MARAHRLGQQNKVNYSETQFVFSLLSSPYDGMIIWQLLISRLTV